MVTNLQAAHDACHVSAEQLELDLVSLYRYASLNEGGNVLRNASLGDFVIVRRMCTYTNLDSTLFYVYGSVHHNIFYE